MKRPEFWKMSQSELEEALVPLIGENDSLKEYILCEGVKYLKENVLKTLVAYKRWTQEESQTLKEMFMNGRNLNIPHTELWEDIGKQLKRSPSEVKRKLLRMYKDDPELSKYKQNSWTREKILSEIKDLYLNNKEINKISLPKHLSFIIHKVIPPQKRCWFDSYDHALAEAVLQAGFPRLENGTLDLNDKFNSLEDALQYIRRQHKKRHKWSSEEMQDILRVLHENDYPLTLRFLANHSDLYRPVLGLNRSIESFKDVIKRFIDQNDVTSFADLVIQIAPEYQEYYNPEKSRLKYSTEELRVKKFLDRFKIPHLIPRLSDKLPTNLPEIPNVVPDFIILDNEQKPIAIVEVFGTIQDRKNNGVGEMYKLKAKNKQQFYPQIPGFEFIQINNNSTACDLSDRSLFERFGKFISKPQLTVEDLGEIITTEDKGQEVLDKFGAAIIFNGKNYRLKTAALDFSFDSLFEIPNKKELQDFVEKYLIGVPERKKLPQILDSENAADFSPAEKAPECDSNRGVGFSETEQRNYSGY